MNRKPFYLYKRQKKYGSYWYVCYINPITGKQENAKSIDTLNAKLGKISFDAIKHREEATLIAYKALEAGLIFTTNQNFESYLLSFWNYDNSSYIKLRNRIKKDSIGKEYCINMLSNIKNHIIPYLPKGIKLTHVLTYHLDKIIEIAFDAKLANGTIQLIILAFSIPLKEAVRQGIINRNPAAYLMNIPRVEKERGVFTDEEIKKILDFIVNEDPSLRLAIKLAITTGMRSGEIRALNIKDISCNYYIREDGIALDKININKSIAPYTGIKGTKGKESRETLIHSSLGKELLDNANYNGQIIHNNRNKPLSSTSLRLSFYKILEILNIDRYERNLTFHSLRHYFATYTKDENIDDFLRMKVLGHKSISVNKRYTHISDKHLEKLSYCIDGLF